MLLVEVPPADCSLLVTGLMIVSLKDLATDLVSALDYKKVKISDEVWCGVVTLPVHGVQISPGD